MIDNIPIIPGLIIALVLWVIVIRQIRKGGI